MSSSPKQTHVTDPQRKHRRKGTTSAVMVAGPSNALADDAMAVDNTTAGGSGAVPPIPLPSTSFTDPHFTIASTPSTYLSRPPQSTISMASTTMTSVSQKRKTASAPGSNIVSEGPKKRSRPSSVATQTQAEKDAMLRRLNSFLDNVDPAALKPVTLASLGISQSQPSVSNSNDNYVEQAANALEPFNLDPSQVNALADYMSEPEHMLRVKFFIKMKNNAQALWITNTLTEIQVKKDIDTQRQSIDSGGESVEHRR
ncbi:hypothetical protein JVT61DRAFT_13595 [Boletus reticuloceps]|uniref:Uncharacterized protein n=1 Tax=Boletus reticuloceps TaxID=495285 RepID=A0A8I2YDD2_9AGAM|nr:hypothetical protein JVT61DRAFT_13595 [Boletus reticuloceps]